VYPKLAYRLNDHVARIEVDSITMSPLLDNLINLDIEFGRDGLLFTIKEGGAIHGVLEVEAKLLLRWAEFVVIVGILLMLWLLIVDRHEIEAMWVFSTWAPANPTDAGVVIGAGALIVGVLLAYWKRKQLFVYGIWEVVFGTFCVVQTAILLWSGPKTAKLVAIASALYVVSRGAGNIYSAFDEERRNNITRIAGRLKLAEVAEETPLSIIKVPDS